MNNDIITIEDCLEMYELRGMSVVIEHGQVIEFVKEAQ